jgi:hypothetical protein
LITAISIGLDEWLSDRLRLQLEPSGTSRFSVRLALPIALLLALPSPLALPFPDPLVGAFGGRLDLVLHLPKFMLAPHMLWIGVE